MKFRNGKLKDLTPQGTLNPNPEAVIDEQFASDDGFFDARDIVQVFGSTAFSIRIRRLSQTRSFKPATSSILRT